MKHESTISSLNQNYQDQEFSGSTKRLLQLCKNRWVQNQWTYYLEENRKLYHLGTQHQATYLEEIFPIKYLLSSFGPDRNNSQTNRKNLTADPPIYHYSTISEHMSKANGNVSNRKWLYLKNMTKATKAIKN